MLGLPVNRVPEGYQERGEYRVKKVPQGFRAHRDLLDLRVPVDRTDCLERKEPKEIAGSWVPQDQEELQE